MGIAQGPGLCTAALVTGVVLAATPAAAQSTPLFPAQVSGANIDCLFSPQCALTPHDEFTDIPLPGISGKAILHSRTFPGAPGSNAAGRTAYQYRIDLTNATTLVDSACVTNLSVKFGPIAKLPYAAGTTLRDVYEIVQGVPTNQIGFATAVQTGNVVTFTFARQICAGEAGSPGDTSFFFGLASLEAPVRGVHVQIDTPVLEDMQVKSFGPLR
jgi:hypothetical protein